ncbi:hypothetical protein BDZ89DRAFT_1162024 [Hymenopellis radicata]|nr:hypothetical protein BDZ89DRAFT_1162024 [Hymenopellis radicata]
MGLFSVFSYSSKSQAVVVVEETVVEQPTLDADRNSRSAPEVYPVEHPEPAQDSTPEVIHVPAQDVPLPLSPVTSVDGEHNNRKRRISLRPFARPRVHEEHTHNLSTIQEHEKKAIAVAALSKSLVVSSSSDKKAKQSALVVRALIIGNTAPSTKVTPLVAKPQLSKVKSQLMKPKSANKVIAHLRQLSVEDAQSRERVPSKGPIHAVCLLHTDPEEHELHFARLCGPIHDHSETTSSFTFPSVSSASVDKLSEILNDMHVIDLVRSPDFGLGQPGDGVGILAGAVPTAETVINGIQQITPQLLALGYATGRAITPDHNGIFPPTDRMSVLTYWWGLEIALPPPSLDYLSNVHSISGAVVNFLSAVSLVNNGVREILPFVRYISQFIDFEFNAIKAQNKGDGVVCAATWLMPAAMVPRPWDFASPPPSTTEAETEKDDPDANAPRVQPAPEDDSQPSVAKPTVPSPTSPSPRVEAPPVPITAPLPIPLPMIAGATSAEGGRHAPSTPLV